MLTGARLVSQQPHHFICAKGGAPKQRGAREDELAHLDFERR